MDKVKLVIAFALLVAGIAGFYYFGEQALVVRVLCVIGGIAAGAAVGWFTTPGQEFFVFARDSWGETKKVVWPSRKEAVQTTAAVFGFVFVMALFLWIVDKGLEWTLYDLILGWKKS